MTTSRQTENPLFPSRDSVCKWLKEELGETSARAVQFICSSDTPSETLCLIRTDQAARAAACASIGGQTFGDDVMVFLSLTPGYLCPIRNSDQARLPPVCSCRPDPSAFP
ncbi:MAG: hypothetical protein ABFE02_05505 [Sulfuricella sp.]